MSWSVTEIGDRPANMQMVYRSDLCIHVLYVDNYNVGYVTDEQRSEDGELIIDWAFIQTQLTNRVLGQKIQLIEGIVSNEPLETEHC